MVIETRRIYSMKKHATVGSFNIFVDRLWARGMKKEEADIDLWLRDIAPSDELRKWFGHDPRKWNEFKERYFKELDGKKELVEPILQKFILTLRYYCFMVPRMRNSTMQWHSRNICLKSWRNKVLSNLHLVDSHRRT